MNCNKKAYPPSPECMFCRKPFEQIKGRRIFAKKTLMINVSDRYNGGGNPDYPSISVKIKGNLYVSFRGPKEKWTNELKEYVVSEFEAGRHPWYCQICGRRTCAVCGSPVQYLHGCEILYDDGTTTHSAILPIPQGCINPNCEKHR